MRRFRKWRKVARRWQALQDIKAARGCTLCGAATTRDPEKLVFMRLPGFPDVRPLYHPQKLTWHQLTAALDAHTVVCRSCFQRLRAHPDHAPKLPAASITAEEIERYGAFFPLEIRHANRRRWSENATH